MRLKSLKLIFFVLLFVFSIPAQEIITKDYLMGKFKPSKDKRFVQTNGFYLRQETYQAYQQMQHEAAINGIHLRIVSAIRTFYQQKQIWEAKWKGKLPVNSDTGEYLPVPNIKTDNLSNEERALRILEFSSMPSASRHHWGTDLDFNDVNPSYWVTARGQKEYAWLFENAPKFGFCQVYSANRQAGYKEEKWHWSYLPLAMKFTEEYSKLITDNDIANTHFVGAETATITHFIENYVLGINQACK